MNSRIEVPHRALEIAAVVTRGKVVEALHAASVAVLDGNGRLVFSFGDPQFRTFGRSALKPLQALPLVTTGAADALGLGPEHLAIACSSHSGSDEHVEVVRELLARVDARVEDLQCGAHLPIGMRLAGRVAAAGEDRDPLRNACSGKHAGFLALARHVGEPLLTYLEPGSRVQTLVRSAVALACEVDVASLETGIDGCSAPNFALPLASLALGFGSLLQSDLADPSLRPALERIGSAMQAHPKLVSGEHRFDYALARTFPGSALAKGGAEAVELMVFREPFFAIAVKIHDGGERALAPVCLSVLEQLGFFSGQTPKGELKQMLRPLVTNHRQLLTGEVLATLRLRPELTGSSGDAVG